MRLTIAGRPPGPAASLLAVPRRTALLGMFTAATIVTGLGALVAVTALLLVAPGIDLRRDIAIPGLAPATAGAAGIAAWILFALAGGARMLRDPGGHATLTFHLPFITAALLLGGPVAGAWVAAVGTIDRRELREAPWYGVLANRGTLILSALAGGLVLEATLAATRLAGLDGGLDAGLIAWLVAGLAGTAVMAIVSTLLTTVTIVLRDGLAPSDTLALMDRSFRRTAVAETLLGWVFVVVWVAAGWWAPALLTVVVLTLWRAASDADAVDHDALTGVLSRQAFAHRAAEAAERARRGGDGAAYLFLDLDAFKTLNDGPRSHHVGDQVLAALGERLRAGTRVTDAVGRRGGDEFMVLLVGVPDEATAAALAGRIHAIVTAPYQTDDGTKTVGVSVGVALAVPGRRDFEPDLRGHADAAMYEAKAAGGGVRIWRESTPD